MFLNSAKSLPRLLLFALPLARAICLSFLNSRYPCSFPFLVRNAILASHSRSVKSRPRQSGSGRIARSRCAVSKVNVQGILQRMDHSSMLTPSANAEKKEKFVGNAPAASRELITEEG